MMDTPVLALGPRLSCNLLKEGVKGNLGSPNTSWRRVWITQRTVGRLYCIVPLLHCCDQALVGKP